MHDYYYKFKNSNYFEIIVIITIIIWWNVEIELDIRRLHHVGYIVLMGTDCYSIELLSLVSHQCSRIWLLLSFTQY